MPRGGHNKKPIPDRDVLVDLYYNQNMNLLNISKHFGNVSNVTVKKWFIHHKIDFKSHRQIIKETHENNPYSSFRFAETQQKVKEIFQEKYGVPYHPNNNTSKTEVEILEFFNSFGCSMRKRRIHGIELDGYCEETGVAFEYCGHYWHNENSPSPKNRLYHYNKFEICRQNNIILFTIFEYEWTERKEQCKNFIQGTLGKNNNKIFARNCEIVTINEKNSEVKAFLEAYHIQGSPVSYTQANILFHNGEIIGVMTFGKHHRQGNNEIVLSRLCWKTDHIVIGGSKRLFHYRPKGKIISWSDNKWSTEGNVYKRLGFVLEKEYKPEYIYVKGKHWKSKQSMTKKNIGASKNQTEWEKALELGWSRMWDCGKKKWLWEGE